MPGDPVAAPRPMLALGLMSGTSCDGIDAALLRTDGAVVLATGGGLTAPYDPSFRASTVDGRAEVTE